MKKILQVVPDEKFIDGTIEFFDNSFTENTYVILDRQQPFQYIKRHPDRVLALTSKKFLAFVYNKDFDLIIFHQLWFSQYRLVIGLPKHIKVVWSSFGIDIYSGQGVLPPLYEIDLYKPITKTLVKCENTIKNHPLYVICKKLVYYFYDRRIQNKVLNRIDYMATVLPIEYERIKQKTGFSAKYFPFQYVSPQTICKGVWIENTASNILLGNSAVATNNHLDVVELLKERGITNECVVPCAYGNYDYMIKLQEKCKDMSNLQFLLDFMPYNEYKQLIRSCRVAVFGHLRQQAIGNVIAAMLQGSKVFLWRDSVAYQYFKSEGYCVYTIEEDLTIQNIEELMTETERELNRSKLEKMFAYTNVKKRIDDVLKQMNI